GVSSSSPMVAERTGPLRPLARPEPAARRPDRIPGYMPSDPRSFAASEDAGRRRAPRMAVALEASLCGRSPRSVTVVDLAVGGCLVRGDAAFDAGAILDLALPLGGAPLAVKVRVVETSLDGDSLPESQPRYFAGLKFMSLSAADEIRLRSFLRSEGRRRRSADSPPA